jgi:hypothetical protein
MDLPSHEGSRIGVARKCEREMGEAYGVSILMLL